MVYLFGISGYLNSRVETQQCSIFPIRAHPRITKPWRRRRRLGFLQHGRRALISKMTAINYFLNDILELILMYKISNNDILFILLCFEDFSIRESLLSDFDTYYLGWPLSWQSKDRMKQRGALRTQRTAKDLADLLVGFMARIFIYSSLTYFSLIHIHKHTYVYTIMI